MTRQDQIEKIIKIMNEDEDALLTNKRAVATKIVDEVIPPETRWQCYRITKKGKIKKCEFVGIDKGNAWYAPPSCLSLRAPIYFVVPKK